MALRNIFLQGILEPQLVVSKAFCANTRATSYGKGSYESSSSVRTRAETTYSTSTSRSVLRKGRAMVLFVTRSDQNPLVSHGPTLG